MQVAKSPDGNGGVYAGMVFGPLKSALAEYVIHILLSSPWKNCLF